jgi:hypothetical protein
MFIIGISGPFIPYLFFLGILVVFSIRISACPFMETGEVDEFPSRRISSDLCSSSPGSATAFYFYENCLQEEPQAIPGINKQSGVREKMQMFFDFVDSQRRFALLFYSLSQVEKFCFSGLSPPHLIRLENNCV